MNGTQYPGPPNWTSDYQNRYGRDIRLPSLRERFPELKVVFMSGYADGMVSPDLLDEKTIFLPKPFSLSALARQIRSLVGNKAESCL